MQQESFNSPGADSRVDLLTLAFKAACQSRQLETASSLLSEIDSALLGQPMGSTDLKIALNRVRAFRSELELLRLEQPVPQAAVRVSAESVSA